jgi:hypothetical protein
MMKKRNSAATSLAGMMAELTVSSWTTILRRTQLMAEGKCTPAEYQRMMMEKADAAQASFIALAQPGAPNPRAVIKPWLVRAKANARRLRRG